MPAPRRADPFRPRKRPLQTRSQRTVEAVLEAAAQVFASRGYAGATTNHIAERAGVSIGSLYEYFPNKDALLVALLEGHLAEGEEVIERAAAEVAARALPIREAIRVFIGAMVDLHERDRGLHRVLFEESPLPRRIRNKIADMEERVTERVERLLRADPSVRVPDPALAAAMVVHTIEALTHKPVIHGGWAADRSAYVEEVARLVESYLTSSPRDSGAPFRRTRGG